MNLQLARAALRLDYDDEQERARIADFLAQAERIQKPLKCVRASRAYRSSFTSLYKRMLGSEGGGYNLDILFGAVMERQNPFELMGNLIPWPETMVDLADELQVSWNLLATGDQHGDLCAQLERFDLAFAGFEKEFVSFLMTLEEIAKAPVKNAAIHATAIRSHSGDLPESESDFVLALQELSSLTSVDGSECEQLSVEVLLSARTNAHGPLRPLCDRVLASFDQAITHFERIGADPSGMDCIRPQLAQNGDMMGVVAEWDESWRLAKCYLCEPRICNSMAKFVAYVRDIAEEPRFGELRAHSGEILFLLPQLFVMFCLQGLQRCHETRSGPDLVQVDAALRQQDCSISSSTDPSSCFGVWSKSEMELESHLDLLALVCDGLTVAGFPELMEVPLVSVEQVVHGEAPAALLKAGNVVQQLDTTAWTQFASVVFAAVVS